jgi:hypothetical protein
MFEVEAKLMVWACLIWIQHFSCYRSTHWLPIVLKTLVIVGKITWTTIWQITKAVSGSTTQKYTNYKKSQSTGQIHEQTVQTLYAGGFLAFDLIVLWTDQRSENVLANGLACNMLVCVCVSVYKITNQFDFRSPNTQRKNKKCKQNMEKGGRKKYITERNGRSSWEWQGIVEFCTCQWNEWIIHSEVFFFYKVQLLEKFALLNNSLYK